MLTKTPFCSTSKDTKSDHQDNNVFAGIGGIAPLAMPFCEEYWAFVIVSVMFGSFLSAWCAVTSPAIVEMCGLDLLTSGFGTLTFVRGFAALIGTHYTPHIYWLT